MALLRLQSPKQLLRTLPRQTHIQRIGTQIELFIPHKLAPRPNPDVLEEAGLISPCEHSPSRHMRDIDLALGPIREPQPQAKRREGLDSRYPVHMTLLRVVKYIRKGRHHGTRRHDPYQFLQANTISSSFPNATHCTVSAAP